MIKKQKTLKSVLCIFATVIYLSGFINTCYAANFVYNKNVEKGTTKTDSSSISTSADVTDDMPVFEFKSEAQILIEPVTGKILYAKNEHEKLLPASVTKIMSILLIMEEIDSGRLKYTDTVACSSNASKLGGSQIWFKEGEKLTIEDALKSIVVASANDVTVAMAELISGSEENFVKKMNEKAKELGMVNTTFLNSHGIDEEGHYTTAYDISLMSRELLNNHPDITKYTTIWMDTIRNGEFGLTNTNKLVRFYEGTIGIKTGSTSKALFNLSAAAKRNDSTFLAVVMKAPSSDIRNEETKKLLDYAFANYKTNTVKKKGEIIGNIKINKNIKEMVNVVIKDGISTLDKKSDKKEYMEETVYYKNISSPIKAGTEIGEYNIIQKGNAEVKYTTKLIVDKDIQNSNVLDYYYYMVKKSFMII